MREILFRGKRLKDGAWIEGFYCEFANNMSGEQEYFIQTVKSDGRIDTLYRVDPSTVGQYTGLTDKNGKRIFEGDVIKTHYANVTKADFVEEVVFHNGRFFAMYQKDGGKMWCPLADGVPHHPGDRTAYMEWCERIGNIHDNPEPLEGGTDDAEIN